MASNPSMLPCLVLLTAFSLLQCQATQPNSTSGPHGNLGDGPVTSAITPKPGHSPGNKMLETKDKVDALPESQSDDLRLVLTEAGFAWRTTELSDEDACSFCRAGTPLTMEALVEEGSVTSSLCVLESAALRNDLATLLSFILDKDEVIGARAVLLASILLRTEHQRIVHGLITHPDPLIRGRGLELAGRAQMSAFMPELSKAARMADGPEREGARMGIALMKTLGGVTLARELEINVPASEDSIDRTLIRPQCPGPVAWDISHHSHGVSSLALGGFRSASSSARELPANTPALLEFAHNAGHAVATENVVDLQNAERLLRTLLQDNKTCITHTCDALLLEELEKAVLSRQPKLLNP